MRYLIAILLFVTVAAHADTTNHVGNITVSAAFAVGTYSICRNVLGSNDRFGCALGAMVISNLIMLCNIHTSDSTTVLATKMKEHAIGSSVVVPITLFDK